MKNYEALELQAKAMRLVEGTELKWFWCIRTARHHDRIYAICPDWDIENYELALAIVEGKPVFDRDSVWYKGASGTWYKTTMNISLIGEEISLSPPKPRTVMVELDYDVVAHAAGLRPDISPAITKACKKALETL